MPYCRKTQRQLQIRLKTLKRTHGVSLDSFPRRFQKQKSSRTRSVGDQNVFTPDNTKIVHDAVSSLFASVLREPVLAPDCHAGEISPTGVSAILAAIPTLTNIDTFVDWIWNWQRGCTSGIRDLCWEMHWD
ncbi:unnamed protein product [Phytophthora fragariaefolia]|uniref:Unnamed protein product n=1 Tax=Phytophthora fragariaefolia TaxID=1490495 RepID=A0A9W6YIB3_9STRA|nr:unnamed protein product [Phytophthora fragariaefolia]